MFSSQTELHDLKAENRCLSMKCDQYKQLFYEALGPVDEVFQETRDNPNPILGDYVQLGESKFEAVKRLAKDYADLKAENERLREEVELYEEMKSGVSLRLNDMATELSDANAKIAELEQSATTLRQLGELLREGWTVVYRIVRDAPVFFVYHQNHLVNPDEFCESTIPAAIAAAFAAKGDG